ncbi:hypothetical protein K4749_01030 [Streptomyces sp. TRM72054]|uniref:hypothetical protein n=1 Tax=Streptomyces sp. TRM72054 TaxID=2870562 RepID=UPI001C8CCD00|nr:hypothetical protein [Streptomyces sp. TRM72054]MBX9392213.1 hypothetical protein [Streptomyces sp. TRM72054]
MTNSLSEWVAFLSLGVGFWAACAALLYLLHDASLADFDPRPALRRAHQGLVHAGHDLNRVIAHAERLARRSALSAAALLLLLSAPTGGTR